VDQVFDKITFDDHTDLQTYFLQGIDLKSATFMLVDDLLRANLNDWIIDRGYRTNVDIAIQYNASADDDRITTKDYYANLLEQHPELVLKLKEHFAEDYELINSVNYYGT
jgi:predicted SnoaL-like aldol condensation-catalyzing enzyme